jgi:hypothetical protein
MTLSKIKDFYASRWINLVHGIAGCSASFAIQVVALNEHRVITEASQPDIAFSTEIELNAFAYMQTAGGERKTRSLGQSFHICEDEDLTELFHFVLFDEHCSTHPSRNDFLPMDQHSRPL